MESWESECFDELQVVSFMLSLVSVSGGSENPGKGGQWPGWWTGGGFFQHCSSTSDGLVMRSEVKIAGIISGELSSGEDLLSRLKTHCWDAQTLCGILSSFECLAKIKKERKEISFWCRQRAHHIVQHFEAKHIKLGSKAYMIQFLCVGLTTFFAKSSSIYSILFNHHRHCVVDAWSYAASPANEDQTEFWGACSDKPMISWTMLASHWNCVWTKWQVRSISPACTVRMARATGACSLSHPCLLSHLLLMWQVALIEWLWSFLCPWWTTKLFTISSSDNPTVPPKSKHIVFLRHVTL